MAETEGGLTEPEETDPNDLDTQEPMPEPKREDESRTPAEADKD